MRSFTSQHKWLSIYLSMVMTYNRNYFFSFVCSWLSLIHPILCWRCLWSNTIWRICLQTVRHFCDNGQSTCPLLATMKALMWPICPPTWCRVCLRRAKRAVGSNANFRLSTPLQNHCLSFFVLWFIYGETATINTIFQFILVKVSTEIDHFFWLVDFLWNGRLPYTTQ